jgi:glycosyltransferase involved in cell wall biosynthesis
VRLNVCMVLPIPYGPNMRIYPQVGICGYLSQFGHNVTWIMWSEELCPEQPIPFKGGQLYTVPYVRYFRGSSMLPKILNILLNTLKRIPATLNIIKKGKYDLIFVIDSSLDGLVAAYIRKRFKVSFVLPLGAPLEERWESFKIMRPMPILFCYLIAKSNEFLTRLLLRAADLILPTSSDLKEHLVEQGVPERKIMDYPNGVDINLFSNRDGMEIRSRYHLEDTEIILYIGTFIKARYLPVLIKAFAKVRQVRRNAKLLMVGSTLYSVSGPRGSDEENLRQLADELGIRDDVIFTGYVPQTDIPDFIAAADITVSPVPPLSFYKMSSPIKLFEYMAMSKPVVASEEIPEHKRVMEQSGGGILVPFSPDAFADAIIELLNHPEIAAEMGRRGRDWLVENRSYEVMARRLERRFQELLATLA